MYLFDSDRQSCGGVIDTTTKNTTFLRMAVMLQKMNIKNNKFFLWLSQPDLRTIDPHNLRDDSVELKQRIAYECKINPWYYFREVLRIESPGGDPIRYILNRANLALMWCNYNEVDSFLTMPRQIGKTIATIGITSWLYGIGGRNCTIGLFAKDTSLVQDNVARLKAMIKSLPPYLVKLQPTKDTDNKEGLSYAALNNRYKTWSAAIDPISAQKQGRGATLVMEHWDEFAYYRYNFLSYPSAQSASDAGMEIAKKSGIPLAHIITTTAGMISDPAGEYAYGIKSGCYRFNEHLYDLENRQALDEFLTDGCSTTRHMVYIEYSYKQLGKDDVWFANVTRNKSQLQIATDYLNEWQLGTGTSIVPSDLLQILSSSVTDPVDVEHSKSCIIKWYVDKNTIMTNPQLRDRNYILGMDTSDNVGKDFTTLCVSDPTDMSVVATLRCNLASMMDVVKCIFELMTQLPNSVLIIERNKNGGIFVDILIDMLLSNHQSPVRRIYNLYNQNNAGGSEDTSRLNYSDGTVRAKFGFNTTASTREQLYSSVLVTLLRYMASRLKDKDLADEIKALSVRNGRIDHPVGQHDDLCMAWMLTGYFALFGRNHILYGIDTSSMMTAVDTRGKKVDEDTKEKQRAYKARIDELKDRISFSTSDVLKAAYEREIRQLEELYDPSLLTETSVTAAHVQQQAKEGSRFDITRFAQIRQLF